MTPLSVFRYSVCHFGGELIQFEDILFKCGISRCIFHYRHDGECFPISVFHYFPDRFFRTFEIFEGKRAGYDYFIQRMQQIRLPAAENFPGEKGKEVVVDKYFFRVFQYLIVIFEGRTEIPVYQCRFFYFWKILFEFAGQDEW